MPNDATDVKNEGRSPKGVMFAEIGFEAVEYRIRDLSRGADLSDILSLRNQAECYLRYELAHDTQVPVDAQGEDPRLWAKADDKSERTANASPTRL